MQTNPFENLYKIQRVPIDPKAFTHLCDNSSSYVPKQRSIKPQQWQKVTDITARGYEPESRQMSGFVSNPNTREKLPRPTFQSITTQKIPDLDYNNRFFVDNQKLLQKFGPHFKLPIESLKPQEQLVKVETADEDKNPAGQVDETCQKTSFELTFAPEVAQECHETTKIQRTHETKTMSRAQQRELEIEQARKERFQKFDPCLQNQTYETTSEWDLINEDRWSTSYRSKFNKQQQKSEQNTRAAGVACRIKRPQSNKQNIAPLR